MRQIIKEREPASLTAHRLTPHSDYDNYAAKDELRNALSAEQRALCCYCMGRIRPDWGSMKIEHWKSQRHHRREQLNYQNLLGGCMGGEGKPPNLQHCDTRKGDADLKWNPAIESHRVETRIFYDSEGTISSNDTVFDTQLNDVLNLNLPRIKNNRKGSLTAVLEWWKSQKDKLHGPPSRRSIEKKIETQTNDHGDLLPFGQVAVWWLRQKLAGMP